MNGSKYTLLATLGMVMLGTFFLTGCSKSTDSATPKQDPLTRVVVGIDDRIDRHDNIMWSDTSFAGRHGEMQQYAEDMDRMMDSLGGILGEFNNCQMQVGGHMMGHQDSDSTCRDEAVLNQLHNEYHHHFEVMQDILENGDALGFIDEMDNHFGHMHEYMETMMQQMDEEYGTRMMLNHDEMGYGHRHGVDDGHGHDNSDSGHHGAGHGPGGM